MVKSLINILKFTYISTLFSIHFFFADIFSLINNLKTFNGHALMLVGKFIDTLAWGSYGSVQDRIIVYGNRTKVSKIV